MPKMPKFEGRQPAAARLKINGLSSDQDEALKVGDLVYLCVEARVASVDHTQDAKVGLIRVHRTAISRHALMDSHEGAALINTSEEQQAQRKALETDNVIQFDKGNQDG